MSNYYDGVLCLAKTLRIFAAYKNCMSQLGLLDVYKTREVTIEYDCLCWTKGSIGINGPSPPLLTEATQMKPQHTGVSQKEEERS